MTRDYIIRFVFGAMVGLICFLSTFLPHYYFKRRKQRRASAAARQRSGAIAFGIPAGMNFEEDLRRVMLHKALMGWAQQALCYTLQIHESGKLAGCRDNRCGDALLEVIARVRGNGAPESLWTDEDSKQLVEATLRYCHEKLTNPVEA